MLEPMVIILVPIPTMWLFKCTFSTNYSTFLFWKLWSITSVIPFSYPFYFSTWKQVVVFFWPLKYAALASCCSVIFLLFHSSLMFFLLNWGRSWCGGFGQLILWGRCFCWCYYSAADARGSRAVVQRKQWHDFYGHFFVSSVNSI